MKQLIYILTILSTTVIGLLLLAVGLAWSQPLHAGGMPQNSNDVCAFTAITVTAQLGQAPGISDTLPFGAESRQIYFANSNDGVITVTAKLNLIDESDVCTVTSSLAFTETVGELEGQQVNALEPTVAYVYPVSRAFTASSSKVIMTATSSSPSDMFSVTLEFIRDVDPPEIQDLTLRDRTTGNMTYTNDRVISTTVHTGSTDIAAWLLREQGDSLPPPVGDDLSWSSTEPVTFTLSSDDGMKTIAAWVRDWVGNMHADPVTKTILLDTKPPSVTVIVPEKVVGNSVIVNWNATDPAPGSGLIQKYDVAYQKDREDWQFLTGTVQTSISFSGEIGHSYTFSVTVQDNAGNMGVGTGTVELSEAKIWLPLVFRAPPLPIAEKLVINAGNKTTHTRQVDLELKATISPEDSVKMMCISNEAESCQNWEDYKTHRSNWELAHGENGLRTVCAQFRGGLGGVSQPICDGIYLLYNGGFEAQWEGWQSGGELEVSLSDSSPFEGRIVMLLGNPNYSNSGGVPVGSARIWRTLNIPPGITTLTLRYRVFSYDKAWSASIQRYLDSFEIYLGDMPDWEALKNPAWNDDRRKDRCRDNLNTAPSADLVAQKGLVFCAGFTTSSSQVQDSGWTELQLDLSKLRGEATIYLANFNRGDGWYNTYTLVDDLKVDGNW